MVSITRKKKQGKLYQEGCVSLTHAHSYTTSKRQQWKKNIAKKHNYSIQTPETCSDFWKLKTPNCKIENLYLRTILV